MKARMRWQDTVLMNSILKNVSKNLLCIKCDVICGFEEFLGEIESSHMMAGRTQTVYHWFWDGFIWGPMTWKWAQDFWDVEPENEFVVYNNSGMRQVNSYMLARKCDDTSKASQATPVFPERSAHSLVAHMCISMLPKVLRSSSTSPKLRRDGLPYPGAGSDMMKAPRGWLPTRRLWGRMGTYLRRKCFEVKLLLEFLRRRRSPCLWCFWKTFAEQTGYHRPSESLAWYVYHCNSESSRYRLHIKNGLFRTSENWTYHPLSAPA